MIVITYLLHNYLGALDKNNNFLLTNVLIGLINTIK